MAGKTLLTNKGTSTFTTNYNGTRYELAPGESIKLNRRTAVGIRGEYTSKDQPVKLELTHLPYEGRTKTFVCHFCGVDFPDEVTLKKHLTTHTSITEDTEEETKQVFVGPDGREFKSKAALMSHMRAIARKQEKEIEDDSSTDSSDDS